VNVPADSTQLPTEKNRGPEPSDKERKRTIGRSKKDEIRCGPPNLAVSESKMVPQPEAERRGAASTAGSGRTGVMRAMGSVNGHQKRDGRDGGAGHRAVGAVPAGSRSRFPTNPRRRSERAFACLCSLPGGLKPLPARRTGCAASTEAEVSLRVHRAGWLPIPCGRAEGGGAFLSGQARPVRQTLVHRQPRNSYCP